MGILILTRGGRTNILSILILARGGRTNILGGRDDMAYQALAKEHLEGQDKQLVGAACDKIDLKRG
jgi:hypothetical protein